MTDQTIAEQFEFSAPPPAKWEFAPTGDFWVLMIKVPKAPNWFHRQMQRLLLGFKYRRL